jgi:hypothetical protein
LRVDLVDYPAERDADAGEENRPSARCASDRATVILQFFAAGVVAAGEIDLVGQDNKAWRAIGKLDADDNEGLLTHCHASARDAIGQQFERVGAI